MAEINASEQRQRAILSLLIRLSEFALTFLHCPAYASCGASHSSSVYCPVSSSSDLVGMISTTRPGGRVLVHGGRPSPEFGTDVGSGSHELATSCTLLKPSRAPSKTEAAGPPLVDVAVADETLLIVVGIEREVENEECE